MKNSMPAISNHRRGFTLVELSIVLVIIGLLIGGILGGQELIRASELNSLRTDATKFTVAMNAFKLKYNALPGDMTNATAYWGAEASCPGSPSTTNIIGTCNGDGDGNVWGGSWVAPATNNNTYRAWEHFALAGIVPGNFTGLPQTASIATSVVRGVNSPETKLNGFWTAHYVVGSANSYNLYGQSFIPYGATPYDTAISPIDLASIDSKYDDGKPAYGTISTYTPSFVAGCASSDTASAATYILTSSTIACWPIFWVK